MSVRKVFNDGYGKELSYRMVSNGLIIEITTSDGTAVSITLDAKDAVQFIQELNKVRKDLK